MLATQFISLTALVLLHLHSIVFCEEFSSDHDKVFQQKEELESELCMLQRGAKTLKPDPQENSTQGSWMEVDDPTAQMVSSLQSQLEAMQKRLEQQRHANQQLLAEVSSTSHIKLGTPLRHASSKPKEDPEWKLSPFPGHEAKSRRMQKVKFVPHPHNKSNLKQEPAAPEEGAPAAPEEGAPAAPEEGAPAAPEAGAPATPEEGAPAEPVEGAPANASESSRPDEGEAVEGEEKKELPELPFNVTENAGNEKFIEALREHFAELALEIQEAKIVSCTIMALIIVFVLTHIMHEYDVHILPEACMVIIVGVLLGFVLKYWCKSRMMFDAEYRSEIAIQMLNEVFLPMLMLEAGWSVRRMDFISQLPYILNFAVIGTLISTGVIGMLLYKTGQAGLHQIDSFRGSMAIAALISATDPVATLGTYADLKVDPLLNIIVFGEAAINDAVAIVVFSIVNDDYTISRFTSATDMVVSGTCSGFRTLTCSFLLGCTVSTMICVVLKAVALRRNKKLEILVVVLGGYLSYSLGEYFRVSGIICTLFNGMFMGKYAKYHLSAEGSLLTSFYISQMSTVMDAGVFLLSGVCCVSLSWSGRRLGLYLMGFCAIARVCSTIPCGILSNIMKRGINRNPNATEADLHILTPRYLFMMWHAGLRGGIAENLALQIGPWFDELEGPGSKEAVRSAVFLLVCTYVVVFGGTTKFFLSMLGIPMGQDNPEDALSKTELIHLEGKVINWLHTNVFFPVLVGRSANNQNDDIIEGIRDDDVLDVLEEVCHGHRGGLMPKTEPKLSRVVQKHFMKGKDTSDS